MNYYLERFEKIYDALYECPEIDRVLYLEDEDEKEFFKEYREAIGNLAKLRGDFFSSDREVKALFLAIKGCTI